MNKIYKKSNRLINTKALKFAEYLIELGIKITPSYTHNRLDKGCGALTEGNVWSPIGQCHYNTDHPLLFVIEDEIEGPSYFNKKIANKYDARDIDWDHYGIGTVCGFGNVIGVSFKNWETFSLALNKYEIPEPSDDFNYYKTSPIFIFRAPEIIRIISAKDSLITGMEIHGEGSFLKLFDGGCCVFIGETLTEIPHLLLGALEGLDHDKK
jgi:hypothetical protein